MIEPDTLKVGDKFEHSSFMLPFEVMAKSKIEICVKYPNGNLSIWDLASNVWWSCSPHVPPKPKRKYVVIWHPPGETGPSKNVDAVAQIRPEGFPKLSSELYRQEIEFDPKKVVK